MCYSCGFTISWLVISLVMYEEKNKIIMIIFYLDNFVIFPKEVRTSTNERYVLVFVQFCLCNVKVFMGYFAKVTQPIKLLRLFQSCPKYHKQ